MPSKTFQIMRNYLPNYPNKNVTYILILQILWYIKKLFYGNIGTEVEISRNKNILNIITWHLSFDSSSCNAIWKIRKNLFLKIYKHKLVQTSSNLRYINLEMNNSSEFEDPNLVIAKWRNKYFHKLITTSDPYIKSPWSFTVNFVDSLWLIPHHSQVKGSSEANYSF